MKSSQPSLSPITGLQLEVLRILWKLGQASVTQVQTALAGTRTLAPTTVGTLLQRLERRKLGGHCRVGRQLHYHALVSAEVVAARSVEVVHESVFQGDLAAFAAQLLSRRDVQASDLAKIRILIEARELELNRDHS